MTTSQNSTEITLWNYVTWKIDPLTGKYHHTFSFTDKAGYLEFRRLWRLEYAKQSFQARVWRRAKLLYRNAGGFRNELFIQGIYPKPTCSISEHLKEVTKLFQNTPVDRARNQRREMCEIRVASKIEAARLRALARQPESAA
jgi:hypothetical protein